MERRIFFEGQVEVKSLVLTKPTGSGVQRVGRIATPNGELAVLCEGEIPVRYLAYVELKAGKLRGNHFHKMRQESFYMIEGEVVLHVEEMATGRKESAILRAGDYALIRPNIAHVFQPLSAGHGLEFAPQEFDANDVYRRTVQESQMG